MKSFRIIFVLSFIFSAFQKDSGWEEIDLFDIGGRECNATHTAESANWRLYHPINLFDNNLSTCWVGANGAIGAKIFMIFDKGAIKVNLANGTQKSKQLFLSNNRVKMIDISIYACFSNQNNVNEKGRIYYCRRFSKTKKIILKDLMGFQSFAFPFDWNELNAFQAESEKNFQAQLNERSQSFQNYYKTKSMKRFMLCLEIKDIYKGSKTNNTCLSEISFSK
jgi:hypothetical protein